MTPGERIGRYRLVALLGTGATGAVWRAVLEGPGGFEREVALKLLRTGADPRADAWLEHEARVGARVHHPHVVATHDLGRAGGQVYVAMELVNGASLADLVRRGPLPPEAVVELGIQVCAGLQAIHEIAVPSSPSGPAPALAEAPEDTWLDDEAAPEPAAPPASTGMVHRDIKPANLLLDRSGMLKIADLGLARAPGAAGPRGGTSGYMPPEQLEGREDARADLFALGVTLLQLATGRRDAGPEAAEAILPGLGGVIGRCVDPDPAHRPSSARELAAALAALRADLPPPQLASLLGDAVDASPVVPPRSTSVPRPPDRLWGRERELDEIEALLDTGEALVTLTGPGGAGKTRLALELAARVPSGLFVDLVGARSADDVLQTVARRLGLPASAATPSRIAHAAAARGARVVVLDNFEQVADHATQTVGRFREAGAVTWLVTSQRPLRLRGERVVPVGPLAEDDAIALFVDRARRDVHDALPVVREIVRTLEGHALAVELAAARTALLAPAALLERLSDRLSVLRGGPADLPERHRSLRASLDASFQLLPAWAQAGLAQLSVFEAPFGVEDAEAVVDVEDAFGIDVVERLLEAHLVSSRGDRLRLAPPVRQYADERLVGAERQAALERHASWLRARVAAAGRQPEGRRGEATRFEDLRAAALGAVARGDAVSATTLAWGAAGALSTRGVPAMVLALLETVVALGPAGPDAARLWVDVARSRLDAGADGVHEALDTAIAGGDAETVAEAHELRGTALARAGDLDGALSSACRAREGFRALRMSSGEASALSLQAVVHFRRSHADAAEACLREALALAGPSDVRRGRFLTNLGAVRELRSDLEGAARCYEDALAQHRRTGDRQGQAMVLGNLGGVASARGDHQQACEQLEAALALQRELGDVRGEAAALVRLGTTLWALRDAEAAEGAYRRAMALAERLGRDDLHELAAVNLGELLVDSGRRAAGREVLRSVLHARDPRVRAHAAVELARAMALDGELEAATELLDEAAELDLPQHLAVVWAVRAVVAAATGRSDEARAALERADALAVRAGVLPGSHVWARVEEARGLV